MPDDAPWTGPVVVPDDISALQADVEAYHREVKHAARRRRYGRLASLFEWPGAGLPLAIVAGAFVVAAIVMVVLTFGDQRPGVRAPEAGPVATSSDARANIGAVGGLLPDVTVRTETGAPRRVRDLRPALFALLPPGCRCSDRLSMLAQAAGEVQVPLVVIAPVAQGGDAATSPTPLGGDRVVPLFDPAGLLSSTYHASGVTVLVVAQDATVRYVDRDVTSAAKLDGPLLSLLQPTADVPVRSH